MVRAGIAAFVRPAPIAAVNSASIRSCMPPLKELAEQFLTVTITERAIRSATRASSSWVIAWVFLREYLVVLTKSHAMAHPTVDRYLHHPTGRQPPSGIGTYRVREFAGHSARDQHRR